MRMFMLSMRTYDAIRNKYEMIGAYADDVDVQLCKDLGIDWRQFEHNVPKQPIDAFLALAYRRFATLTLPTNETQWTVQRGRFADLWHSWVESECVRLGCLEKHHYDCGERYNRPSFWELASQLEEIRQGKAKLIATLDTKPRGRAVKVANDSLARIAADIRYAPMEKRARRP